MVFAQEKKELFMLDSLNDTHEWVIETRDIIGDNVEHWPAHAYFVKKGYNTDKSKFPSFRAASPEEINQTIDRKGKNNEFKKKIIREMIEKRIVFNDHIHDIKNFSYKIIQKLSSSEKKQFDKNFDFLKEHIYRLEEHTYGNNDRSNLSLVLEIISAMKGNLS